jgi:hypothetical protein
VLCVGGPRCGASSSLRPAVRRDRTTTARRGGWPAGVACLRPRLVRAKRFPSVPKVRRGILGAMAPKTHERTRIPSPTDRLQPRLCAQGDFPRIRRPTSVRWGLDDPGGSLTHQRSGFTAQRSAGAAASRSACLRFAWSPFLVAVLTVSSRGAACGGRVPAQPARPTTAGTARSSPGRARARRPGPSPRRAGRGDGAAGPSSGRARPRPPSTAPNLSPARLYRRGRTPHADVVLAPRQRGSRCVRQWSRHSCGDRRRT